MPLTMDESDTANAGEGLESAGAEVLQSEARSPLEHLVVDGHHVAQLG
jgi:hypothetical protein